MSEEIIEAAVCLWEACLESSFPSYERYREIHGAAQTRSVVISFAPLCHEAWAFAHTELGFDDPFDWEWCPAFLDACVDEDFTLKFENAEDAALAVMNTRD